VPLPLSPACQPGVGRSWIWPRGYSIGSFFWKVLRVAWDIQALKGRPGAPGPRSSVSLFLWYDHRMATGPRGKPRMYLETSVPSAHWDDREPRRMAKTGEWWR
jgi:hypothetical protein